MAMMAVSAMGNSGRFSLTSITRSPGCSPCAFSAAARLAPPAGSTKAKPVCGALSAQYSVTPAARPPPPTGSTTRSGGPSICASISSGRSLAGSAAAIARKASRSRAWKASASASLSRRIGREIGVFSPNDIRRRENETPIPGGQAAPSAATWFGVYLRRDADMRAAQDLDALDVGDR